MSAITPNASSGAPPAYNTINFWEKSTPKNRVTKATVTFVKVKEKRKRDIEKATNDIALENITSATPLLEKKKIEVKKCCQLSEGAKMLACITSVISIVGGTILTLALGKFLQRDESDPSCVEFRALQDEIVGSTTNISIDIVQNLVNNRFGNTQIVGLREDLTDLFNDLTTQNVDCF